MPDKYDDAIAYLENRGPEEIKVAWNLPSDHPAGCLFQIVARPGEARILGQGLEIGCLTQIRYSDKKIASTANLTARIKADRRIPSRMADVKLRHLPLFAEWQRQIDTELERV